jgi:NTE family protein
VRKHLVSEQVEHTHIPLHVIATDVLTGEEVRLSNGPLIDAIMASAAIPGVLPSVSWDGRELIDGGVSNNAPISHAFELGADEVYVLPTAGPCELDDPPRGALAMLVYATGVLVRQGLARDLARLPHTERVIVLPPPCPIRIQPSDFSQADCLIEEGYLEAMRFLAQRSRDKVVPLARCA